MASRNVVLFGAVGCLLAFGAAVVAAGAGYWYYTTTPTYSVRRIERSLESHDAALFQKHVAIDEVVSAFVDVAVESGQSPSAGGSDAGRILGQGILALMKPRLIEAARKSILHYVETGDVKDGSLGAIEYVERSGKTAFVGITATSEGRQLSLRFRLRDMGRYWQVVELANAKELLAQQAAAPRPQK